MGGRDIAGKLLEHMEPTWQERRPSSEDRWFRLDVSPARELSEGQRPVTDSAPRGVRQSEHCSPAIVTAAVAAL